MRHVVGMRASGKPFRVIAETLGLSEAEVIGIVDRELRKTWRH